MASPRDPPGHTGKRLSAALREARQPEATAPRIRGGPTCSRRRSRERFEAPPASPDPHGPARCSRTSERHATYSARTTWRSSSDTCGANPAPFAFCRLSTRMLVGNTVSPRQEKGDRVYHGRGGIPMGFLFRGGSRSRRASRRPADGRSGVAAALAGIEDSRLHDEPGALPRSRGRVPQRGLLDVLVTACAPRGHHANVGVSGGPAFNARMLVRRAGYSHRAAASRD